MGSPAGTWGQLSSVPGSPLVVSIQEAALGSIAIYDPVTGVLTPSGIGYTDVPQAVSISLTSAQLLALSTTPVQVLPPPGAGLYYWVQSVILEYTFVSVAYTSAAHTQDCYLNWQGQVMNSSNAPWLYNWCNAATGIIEATQSCTYLSPAGNGLQNMTAMVNKALMFGAPNAITLGDGTLKVTVAYIKLQI